VIAFFFAVPDPPLVKCASVEIVYVSFPRGRIPVEDAHPAAIKIALIVKVFNFIANPRRLNQVTVWVMQDDKINNR